MSALSVIGPDVTVAPALGPLFELSRLALVAGPHRGWNRDVHDLPYAHDIPDDDPRQVEYARLVLRL